MMLHCYLKFIAFLLFIFMYFANSVPAPTSGPFRSMILSVVNCANTSRPMMKNPPMTYDASVTHGNGKPNLLYQKFTVGREVKNVKVKVKGLLWSKGKWELIFVINYIDCHEILFQLIALSVQLKYDEKTCTYFKGSYSSTMEINTLQHIWTSKLEYGRVMWRAEATISAGTMFCKEYDTVTEPIQTPKHLNNTKKTKSIG